MTQPTPVLQRGSRKFAARYATLTRNILSSLTAPTGWRSGILRFAISFVGAYRDPVRNAWLFTFGTIACWLVIPFALIFGELRGIPFLWRLIDSSFGVVGLVPLWICKRYLKHLSSLCAE